MLAPSVCGPVPAGWCCTWLGPCAHLESKRSVWRTGTPSSRFRPRKDLEKARSKRVKFWKATGKRPRESMRGRREKGRKGKGIAKRKKGGRKAERRKAETGLTTVGFEPTPLARRGPEPRALDRSATSSLDEHNPESYRTLRPATPAVAAPTAARRHRGHALTR